jgi:DNA-binding NarL/FixJ family response regulator
MKRYRVLVVEPSRLIAEGLRVMLAQSEFEVVAMVSDIRQMLERLTSYEPDVVILGSQVVCAQKQGLRFTYPQLQDVALVMLSTTVCDDESVRQVDGLINIYDDTRSIERKLQVAVEQSQTNPYSDSHELSERERDVLVLVAKGLANKEIADRLNISIHTVITHRKNIAHKTGIKSVAGLTVYALLNNLLDPTDVTL